MGIALFTGVFESVWQSEKLSGSVYDVGSGGDDGEVRVKVFGLRPAEE